MQELISWWKRGLIVALCVSICLLGIGRLEFFSTGISVSAWSVSRTTFFFWFGLKLVLLTRGGWAASGLADLKPFAPLLVFFSAVTLSLLPDFRQAGDYRYFLFGCGHAFMVADLFSSGPQKRWLPVLLGIVPVVAVVRGLAHDPEILNLTLSERFGFPLDHANSAGYLFAMSIPLGLMVAKTLRGGWLGSLSLLSCASQLFALVLTFSRGAWLGWAAAMLYLTLALKKWKIFLLALITMATCVIVLPSVQDRLVTLTQPRDDLSIRNRLQLLTSSIQLGLENPVLGIGYGRGRLKEALRPRLHGTEFGDAPIWHTHNLYVELFVGTGAVGLLAFLWLIGTTLRGLLGIARRADESDSLVGCAFTASWIAMIVAGVGDIPFYHHESRIFFFTLVGTAHIYYSSANKSETVRVNSWISA